MGSSPASRSRDRKTSCCSGTTRSRNGRRAQGYQESELDQSKRSAVGAIGVMQVMPETGRDMRVGDINQIEPNIHAGVKFLRSMMNEYYANEPMDRLNKGLFAFASYNAGPG